jgi:hypothetical protein
VRSSIHFSQTTLGRQVIAEVVAFAMAIVVRARAVHPVHSVFELASRQIGRILIDSRPFSMRRELFSLWNGQFHYFDKRSNSDVVSRSFTSEESALMHACDLQRNGSRVNYVRGPGKQHIQPSAIAAWCRKHKTSMRPVDPIRPPSWDPFGKLSLDVNICSYARLRSFRQFRRRSESNDSDKTFEKAY